MVIICAEIIDRPKGIFHAEYGMRLERRNSLSTIKHIPRGDLEQFVQIVADAYPAMDLNSGDANRRTVDNLEQSYIEDQRQLFGLYRDGSLLGGMFLYDFNMMIHADIVETGGIGLVAVHLLHKKEKVAKELIDFALDYYRKRKAPLVSLYPFRPDFYKRMGFGYGPKISRYQALPSSLPRGGSKDNVQYLEESDGLKILKCYDQFARSTHGMILRNLKDTERQLFKSGSKVLAYQEEESVRGYISYSFEKGKTFLENDLIVKELVADEPEVLNQLLTFLHTQLDQVRRIVFDLHDSDFHHLLADPRNGSGKIIPFVYHETNTQGMGLMYRVVDIPLMIESSKSRNFGDQTIILELKISDSFLPVNAGSYVMTYVGGSGSFTPDAVPEASIELDIADFSSLLMGTVSFRSQYMYGLAEISDPNYVSVVNELFRVDKQPICMTQF